MKLEIIILTLVSFLSLSGTIVAVKQSHENARRLKQLKCQEGEDL